MKTNTFNIADHLETEDDIKGFLKEVVSTGSTENFIHALNIAAKAKGMSEVAKKSRR